jgi:hypothetical protein
MSTLPLRASDVQPVSLPGIARLVSAVVMVIDVFAEAQAQARAAHQKYPFAEW